MTSPFICTLLCLNFNGTKKDRISPPFLRLPCLKLCLKECSSGYKTKKKREEIKKREKSFLVLFLSFCLEYRFSRFLSPSFLGRLYCLKQIVSSFSVLSMLLTVFGVHFKGKEWAERKQHDHHDKTWEDGNRVTLCVEEKEKQLR